METPMGGFNDMVGGERPALAARERGQDADRDSAIAP